MFIRTFYSQTVTLSKQIVTLSSQMITLSYQILTLSEQILLPAVSLPSNETSYSLICTIYECLCTTLLYAYPVWGISLTMDKNTMGLTVPFDPNHCPTKVNISFFHNVQNRLESKGYRRLNGYTVQRHMVPYISQNSPTCLFRVA